MRSEAGLPPMLSHVRSKVLPSSKDILVLLVNNLGG